MTCYWDNKYIDALDDWELKKSIYAYREDMDEDW